MILHADDLVQTQAPLVIAGASISRATCAFPGGRRFHFVDPDGYELAEWSAD